MRNSRFKQYSFFASFNPALAGAFKSAYKARETTQFHCSSCSGPAI